MKPAKSKLSMRRPSLSVVSDAARMGALATELEGQARLNIVLTETLHAKVKARAAERRLSMTDYVLGLFRADGLD